MKAALIVCLCTAPAVADDLPPNMAEVQIEAQNCEPEALKRLEREQNDRIARDHPEATGWGKDWIVLEGSRNDHYCTIVIPRPAH
jgi:hypothetical protein